MDVKNIFVMTFLIIYISLNVCVGICIKPYGYLAIIQFIIIQLINIGIAYSFTEIFLSLILPKNDLPKLNKLIEYPPVALLYVTYEDMNPQLLNKLRDQKYKNYKIFVLDDSVSERQTTYMERCSYNIIKRPARNGYKAGALNNWLKLYGKNYKYFIVADSDSAFDQDFIENMVKYAEHPLNINISIFQSFIINWNNKNKFASILSATYPLHQFIAYKLFNSCDYIVSWGHNNLHRTSNIIILNGFDENFIAEDLSLGLKVIKNGYRCQLVDIISYEMVPQTVDSYAKRQERWARQNFELLKSNTNGIPFISRLHLFMLTYNFIIWYIYILGTIITIFNNNSRISGLSIIYDIVISNSQFFSLWIFYTIVFLFMRYPISLKLGLSTKTYFKNFILQNSVNYFSMVNILIGIAKTITGSKVAFDVTEKTQIKSGIFKNFKITILFFVVIAVAILNNPFLLIFNSIWLIPMLMSPFIIYLAESKSS